ncbi:ribonuclease HII [Nanoarchaeota archaeon]
MKLLGIDEAGRGPIIGPMVMCAVYMNDPATLEQIGVKDSKLLTPKQREELYDELVQFVDKYELAIVEPIEIDEAVNVTRLNWLEADKSIEMINKLNPKKAILDCPSKNPSSYKEYVFERLEDKKTELICEHKADGNYEVVAAASIIAKVTRDRIIEDLKKKLNSDFGSGYLSDPKTQKFLKESWKEHHSVFRKSWRPYKDLAFARNQSSLGDF